MAVGASLGGIGLAIWRALQEGWGSLQAAVLFATLAAGAFALGLTSALLWLDLLRRPQPEAGSKPDVVI